MAEIENRQHSVLMDGQSLFPNESHAGERIGLNYLLGQSNADIGIGGGNVA